MNASCLLRVYATGCARRADGHTTLGYFWASGKKHLCGGRPRKFNIAV
jgi:hypothetical protein